MWPESKEQPQKLRTGLTTGCCATACSVAAAEYLLTGTPASAISVTLPKGKTVGLAICRQGLDDESAFAATIKDAGDDPDVTHGAEISVRVNKIQTTNIQFVAGEGVGTVTREGLLLAVGEPAINPIPRKMMTEHLQEVAKKYHYQGGFTITVSVSNGKELALKTMNPRLGIQGGLSILGTTGIVRPFSCSAYIASIHQGVDVARANGVKHIAATTGNSSETTVKTRYALTDMALIEMGDFVGALLKHLRKHPVEHLTLCGGFGKISKLAKGHMDLHSKVSSIDFEFLASTAQALGADAQLQEKILQANTSVEALKLCQTQAIALGDKICQLAQQWAKSVIRQDVLLNVIAIDRTGHVVGEFGDEVMQ